MARQRLTGPRRPKAPYATISALAVVGGLGCLLLPLFGSFPWGSALRILIACGTVAGWAAWLGRRSRLPTADQVREVDRRPPVLFLRTFGKEAVSFSRKELSPDLNPLQRAIRRLREDPFEGVQTLERFLSAELTKRVGPLMGLGDPTDRLPREGAARTWVADGTWRSEILRLIAEARCVIAEIHASPGLAWELAQVLDAGRHRRLFLFTAPSTVGGRISTAVSVNNRVFRQHPESWENTVAFMKDVGYALPEVHPGPGAVLGFNPSGGAILLTTGATTAAGFVTPVVEALATMEAEAAGQP